MGIYTLLHDHDALGHASRGRLALESCSSVERLFSLSASVQDLKNIEYSSNVVVTRILKPASEEVLSPMMESMTAAGAFADCESCSRAFSSAFWLSWLCFSKCTEIKNMRRRSIDFLGFFCKQGETQDPKVMRTNLTLFQTCLG